MLQSMGSQRVRHNLVTEQTVKEFKHVRKEREVEAQNLALCFPVFTRFIFVILLFLVVGVIKVPSMQKPVGNVLKGQPNRHFSSK